MAKVFRCDCGEVKVVNQDIIIVQCVHCGQFMEESGRRRLFSNLGVIKQNVEVN